MIYTPVSKKIKDNQSTAREPTSSNEVYIASLRQLPVELVKLRRHIIKREEKILALFEGRDAYGKDGTIKRVARIHG